MATCVVDYRYGSTDTYVSTRTGIVYVPYVCTLRCARRYFDLRIPKGMAWVYKFLLALCRRSYLECRARALICRIYRRCWKSKGHDRVSSSFLSIVAICLPCSKFYHVSPLSECGLLEFTCLSFIGLLLLSSLALSYFPFFRERLSSLRWCTPITWTR